MRRLGSSGDQCGWNRVQGSCEEQVWWPGGSFHCEWVRRGLSRFRFSVWRTDAEGTPGGSGDQLGGFTCAQVGGDARRGEGCVFWRQSRAQSWWSGLGGVRTGVQAEGRGGQHVPSARVGVGVAGLGHVKVRHRDMRAAVEDTAGQVGLGPRREGPLEVWTCASFTQGAWVPPRGRQ